MGESDIARAVQEILASVNPKEPPKLPTVYNSNPPKQEEKSTRNSADSSVRYSIASCCSRDAELQDLCADITDMAMRNRAFGKELVCLVNAKCGGKASLCYRAAGISRQVYSRIISDSTSKVARRTAYQLCIGLALSRVEADSFLAKAGYAFMPNDIESQAFAYCIQNRIYNLFDINDILVRLGCEPISIG
jgi:hypothetical protein